MFGTQLVWHFSCRCISRSSLKIIMTFKPFFSDLMAWRSRWCNRKCVCNAQRAAPEAAAQSPRPGGNWSHSPARSLVEKFDTELFSDFSAKPSNFRRLVLSCINADFCVQILILQRFSRSTRFSHLCTARNSKSSQIFVKLFHMFAGIYAKIAIFKTIFIEFCTNFDEKFSEFRWII